ncbi:conserved hypothetical protein [Leishmania braziliensis MHOM/BR/75/M2904]|uniref:Uncharacterized protein n=2 Tax=Leishmania braziliensis TaxID=5660 RepID=A4H4N1_LEIBR|nr:conserved hypothetical protein [Leishmania braziliensis MHOM/BR/75/M2904]KAI5690011.1 hypothetical protein MNV84_00720 [Leishmania braziliensis]CAJ2466612.1 unnamed protein product [Leishmania braziliensis]CAM37024.1 conserved hypothetical protein [Leishmania braziliensis MHOM/BR/75/M2904]SYZ62893.1 hypothetical_protein [Leishmania braziliensis MHOM/BR/75/M2904]
MGCKSSKTRRERRRGSTETPEDAAPSELVGSVDPLEPVTVRVSEPVQPRAAVGTNVGGDEGEPESPAQQSSEASVAFVNAPNDSIYTAQSPLEFAANPQSDGGALEEADNVSKNLNVEPDQPASRTSSSKKPQPKRDEASAGNQIHSEVESHHSAEKATADEWEVELSLPRSAPPLAQVQQPEAAPVPPLAATPALYDEEATTPLGMESIPEPTPKRQTPRSRPPSDIATRQHARAVASSNASASAPRRYSRKSSVGGSSSGTVRPSGRSSHRAMLQPRAHNGGRPPVRQDCGAQAEAASFPQYAVCGDDYRASAAAPLSPTASLVSASATPVIREELIPNTEVSERMVADYHSPDANHDEVALLQSAGRLAYRESPADLRMSFLQRPPKPVSQRWWRGFTSPIPYRRGYTNPTPGAGPQAHRPSTTYMPPPTAYIMRAPGAAPPRLSFDPSALAAMEAPNTRLVQAPILRLADTYTGTATSMSANSGGNEESTPTSQHSAATSMSALSASRLSGSGADAYIYEGPEKFPPSYLSELVYTPAAPAAGATGAAAAVTQPSLGAGFLHSHSSQRPRLANPAPRAQQQQRSSEGLYATEQPPQKHLFSRSGLRVRAAVNRAANHYGYDVDAVDAEGSCDTASELYVYS